MQATRIHLALVIDEYGGSDGLVSIEDLVELIVGDIADEHDEAEMPAVTRQTDGSFLATGRASLDDVRAVIGEEFDVGEAAQDVDTLGGYLVTRAGHVPVRGELVPGPASRSKPRCSTPTRAGSNASNLSRKDRRTARRGRLPAPAKTPPARPGPARRGRRLTRTRRGHREARGIHAIVLSWGWRRRLIAFAAGVISALAMAPFMPGRFCF